MNFTKKAVLWTLLSAVIPFTKAEVPSKKVLTLEMAKRAAAASETEANRRGSTVVIVVVDDGTQVASVEVGIGKARTAAIFRRPSGDFEEQIKNGRAATLVLPGATPLQGGVPIRLDGKVIGAIGVSGNTPQEDEDIAKVGAAAVEAALTAEDRGGSHE
jgi:glc operon protein GlcG